MEFTVPGGVKGWCKLRLLACLSFFMIQRVEAQLFPGLVGEPLVEALREEFTPGLLLNDTQVKDTLYAKVFLVQDSVRCIYSGLARLLPLGVDPSQWLYLNGIEVGSINLEHSWPQAKGAGEGTNGNMDMHHLFPSRAGINSDRGDFPYSDFNDNQTQRWYYQSNEMSVKPNSNINAYSELGNGTFEPRESVKGDIARAMFYFWTIYRDDAIAADPLFFESQLNYLCQWHELDPVDDLESLRNVRISTYQDGKMNPFILDCSLVQRAYCSQLTECETVSAVDIQGGNAYIHYTPTLQLVSILGKESNAWNFMIIDLMGRVVFSDRFYSNLPGSSISIPSGLYIALAENGISRLVQKIYIP